MILTLVQMTVAPSLHSCTTALGLQVYKFHRFHIMPRDLPIMLKILPIMLCYTAQKLYTLCSKLIMLNIYPSVPIK